MRLEKHIYILRHDLTTNKNTCHLSPVFGIISSSFRGWHMAITSLYLLTQHFLIHRYCFSCCQGHICITGLSSLFPSANHTQLVRVYAEIKACLLPAKSRKGSCWLRGVLVSSGGGETASWVTARDWETQQLSESPARAACCLLRLIPQWNPSTNPIDGPPLLYQLKPNSTTGPPLVEPQE